MAGPGFELMAMEIRVIRISLTNISFFAIIDCSAWRVQTSGRRCQSYRFPVAAALPAFLRGHVHICGSFEYFIVIFLVF